MYFCAVNNSDKDMTNTKTRTIGGLVLADALLIGAACVVPAASHLLALPLYMLNPMLALLLAGMLMESRLLAKYQSVNGFVLALLMPAVSCMVTGMPAPAKMVCMVAELTTVAALFGWLSRSWKVLPAVLTAIVGGKVVYYALKAIVIAPAVLVDTNLWLQLAVVLLWGGMFALLYRK